jgi:hypothetical protein
VGGVGNWLCDLSWEQDRVHKNYPGLLLCRQGRDTEGAALAHNEIDGEPVIAHQERRRLETGLNSGNYKVVTGACSSTGKLSSQKVGKVRSLDKELTDALTAGKGIIRVQF